MLLRKDKIQLKKSAREYQYPSDPAEKAISDDDEAIKAWLGRIVGSDVISQLERGVKLEVVNGDWKIA